VLFDMNGVNVYDGFLTNFDTIDNAQARAIYDPPTGPNETVGPFVFEDELVIAGAQFFNDNYRRYNEMDPVRTFIALGEGELVPEPGSAVLAAMAALGALLLPRRRR
jgi:hypothetical protein